MIEAMKQALEALEIAAELLTRVGLCFKGIDKTITSLRQAIAEAEKQEPVAWIEHVWSGSGLRHLHFERREQSLRDEVVNPIWTPLYINPQPKREWVGLTVMEAVELDIATNHPREFAAAIEAKLKDKNGF